MTSRIVWKTKQTRQKKTNSDYDEHFQKHESVQGKFFFWPANFCHWKFHQTDEMAKRKATKSQKQKQLRDEEEIGRSNEGLLFNQNAGVGFSEKVDCHFDGMAWIEE